MKIDTSLLVHDLSQMPALARSADEMSFDGLWTFETAHEPFLPLVLAAEHSRRLSLGTSIAVAFARSPAVPAPTIRTYRASLKCSTFLCAVNQTFACRLASGRSQARTPCSSES